MIHTARTYENIDKIIPDLLKSVRWYAEDVAKGHLKKGKPQEILALNQIRRLAGDIEKSYQQLIEDHSIGAIHENEYQALLKKYIVGCVPTRDSGSIDHFIKDITEKEAAILKNNYVHQQ